MTGTAHQRERSPSKRRDIQGLRGIAVLLVLAYHDLIPGLHGGYIGVDVFFVISGFVITRSLLLHSTEDGLSSSLLSFYLGRARRILPAASATLVCTTALALILLDPISAKMAIAPLGSAASFVSNWWFLDQQHSYLLATHQSLFDHYWSLSLEEQIYVVWPLLLLLVARRPPRFAILATSLIAAGSLALCITVTAYDPSAAFYSTQTRAWEFAVGAILYLLLRDRPPTRQSFQAVLGAVGALSIGYAAVFFDGSTPFPGWRAIIPVVGAVAVIAAGTGNTKQRCIVTRTLQSRMLVAVGDRSYSIYLWHLPIIGLAHLRAPTWSASITGRTSLAAASVLVGAIAFQLVEDPARSARLLRRWSLPSAAAVAACVVAPLIITFAAPIVKPLSAGGAAASAVRGNPPRDPGFVPSDLIVPLDKVSRDSAVIYHDGCHLSALAVVGPACIFGDKTASRTLVLVGDSHAAQWFPAFEDYALHKHFRLISLTKSGCMFDDLAQYMATLKRTYTECVGWYVRTLERIKQTHPSLIVTSGATYAYAEHHSGLAGPAVSLVLSHLRAGVRDLLRIAPVLAIGDTPHWPYDPSTCLARNLSRSGACSGRPNQLIDIPLEAALRDGVQRMGAVWFDPTPFVCNATCPLIDGNVVMYFDSTHLSATFARTLSGEVGSAIDSVLHKSHRSLR